MSRKIIILVGLFILLFIIFIISLIMSRKSDPRPVSPTPTSTINVSTPVVTKRPSPLPIEPLEPNTPTPLPVPVTGTGARSEVPTDAPDHTNTAFELRKKLPIETNTFTLEHDYANSNFTVTLKDPTDANRLLFYNWLESNGYGAIPDDEFVFQ